MYYNNIIIMRHHWGVMESIMRYFLSNGFCRYLRGREMWGVGRFLHQSFLSTHLSPLMKDAHNLMGGCGRFSHGYGAGWIPPWSAEESATSIHGIDGSVKKTRARSERKGYGWWENTEQYPLLKKNSFLQFF